MASSRRLTLVPRDDFRAHVAIVRGVRAGNATAMEDLYRICQFHRYHLFAALRQDGEDKLHDIYISVVEAIRANKLADPQRLIGFVHIVTRRRIADAIKANVRKRGTELAQDVSDYAEWLIDDPRNNPERAAIARERQSVARKALTELTEGEREILERFYLMEHDWPAIAEEMGFNSHQFRCHKSRAKGKFGVVGQRAISSKRKALQTTIADALESLENLPKAA